MKTIKRLLATAAALTITASGFSITSPFFISFDFDSGASPTVTDPAGAFASVSDMVGGVVSSGAMNAMVTPTTPAEFSFDFAVNAPYTASIISIGYNAVFEGQIAALTDLSLDSTSLNGQVLIPSVSQAVAFLPALNGLTGGTITFQALGLGAGSIALKDLNIVGSVTYNEKPTATVPDSSTSLLGFFAIAGLVAFRATSRRK